MNLAKLVCFAVLATSLAPSLAQAQDSAGATNQIIQVPAGWSRDDLGSSTILTPNSAPKNSVVIVLEGSPFSGDLRTRFDQTFGKPLNGQRILNTGQLQSARTAQGVEMLAMTAEVQLADGSHSYRYYVAAGTPGSFEVLLYIADSPLLFQRYESDVKQLIATRQFVLNTSAGAPRIIPAVPPADVSRPNPGISGDPAQGSAPSSSSARAAAPPQGERDSYGAASYTVPPGWSRILNPNNPRATTYQSPVYNGGEVCRIAVFPPMPSSGDIVNDARTTFAAMMGVDPLANSGPPFPYTTIIRGVSPEGWSYFIIKHSINGRFGEYGRLYGTTTLAVQLGNQTVIIVGTGKDPQVSQCFGELVRDAWPAFFASLHFNTKPSPQQEQAFRSGIVGTWTAVASSMAAGQYTFTGQGRYLSTAAFVQRTPAGANRILETTSAYFGDGRFSFQGNMLVLTPDNGQGNPTNAVIRIEQESKDLGVQLGAKWTDRLCLMYGSGEICYNRSR